MSPGKLAAQACHASLGAFCHPKATEKIIDQWGDDGHTKVVLGVADRAELHVIDTAALHAGVPRYLVHDAGRTELEIGTTTCLGIGPAEESIIDKLTGHLKLY